MRPSLLILTLALAAGLPSRARAQGQAANGQMAPNAPADRLVPATADCQWLALRKAMEPYVAQARETYPEARRRFIARPQPARPMFVTTQLHDTGGRREQVFVAVDSIVGPRIYGSLASEVSTVQGYQYHQPISLDESDLMDWMFANPDGSEEGNVVGKFLDSYTPPACREG
jgi:uncharacterized protein YegJ (DUF2314 family)